MKKKIFSLAMTVMLLLVSIVSAADISGNGVIEVEGFKSYDSRKSMDELRRMAVLEGYRTLAEALGDLKISSTSTMKDLSHLDDKVRVEVEKTVHGARVISVERDSEGNFHSRIRLNLYGGANSIANIVIPKDTPVEPFPDFNPIFLTMNSNYTGLIIDCGGQEISTAMLPKIKSVSGKEVYAFKYLDRNIVVGRGMVNYSDGENSGTKRAGSNPLTIPAMFIEGECDVVVSDDDAEKILAANSKTNFLKNCTVVFVK